MAYANIPNEVSAQWWMDSPGMTRAQRVQDVTSAIWRSQSQLRDQLALNLRGYGDLHVTGLTPKFYRNRGSAGLRSMRLAMNVTKSVVDTWVAMLTKDQPKVTCLTSEGNWNEQEAAKKRERFLDGAFYENAFRETSEECAYDCGKMSIGVVYFYPDESDPERAKLATERVLPWEILVSDQDATYRKPNSIHRIKWVDRYELMKKHPKFADELKTASTRAFDEQGPSSASVFYDKTVDLLPVIASWHLPSTTVASDTQDSEAEGTPTTDGRFSVTVANITLKDEEWPYDYIPFEILYRQTPTTGIWGCSLVEELSPQQRELNVLLSKVQRSIHLLGAGHWVLANGARINSNHMDNQLGSIIRTSGSVDDMKFEAVQTVNAETYQQIDRIKASMYETSGISPQMAQGVTQTNLTSGEAQRVHADIAAARFEPNERQFGDFFLRCAKQFMRLADRIHLNSNRLSVSCEKFGSTTTVDYEDIKAPPNSLALRLYPTSQLPDTPEGRLSFAQDLINSGMLPDKSAAMRLLNFPDLSSFNDIYNASYNYSCWCIDGILYDGEYRAPIGMMNLDEAKALGVANYLNAKRKGCPEERLTDLLRWVVQCDDVRPEPPTPAIPPAQSAAPPPQQQAA